MTVAAVTSAARAFSRSVYGPIWLGFVLLRIVSAFGVGNPRFPDTASWLDLDFSGSAIRLWVIPTFFNVLPTDSLRVGGMVFLGVVAWSALGASVVSIIKNRILKPIALASVLLLGLTDQVTTFDTLILGESIAISVMVAVVAAWIWSVHAPSVWSASSVAFGMIIFAFTRHPNIVLTLCVALILAASLVFRGSRRLRVGLLVVLLAIVAVGWPMIDKNRFNTEENLATVMSERILTNPELTDWLTERGMPISPEIRELAGSYYTRGLGSTLIRNDKRLWGWILTDGRDAYLKFLVTHPGYTFGTPARDTVDPKTAILSGSLRDYSPGRPVLPMPFQQIFWGEGPGGLLFMTAGAFALAATAIIRRGLTMTYVVPAMTAVIGWGGVILAYHGAASEPFRHALLGAATFRVGLILLILVALDRLILKTVDDPKQVNRRETVAHEGS